MKGSSFVQSVNKPVHLPVASFYARVLHARAQGVTRMRVVFDTKNQVFVKICDALADAVEKRPDPDAPLLLPTLSPAAIQRHLPAIALCRHAAHDCGLSAEIVLALEMRATGPDQRVPFKQRVAAGPTREQLQVTLGRQLAELYSVRLTKEGAEQALVRGVHARRRLAQKAARTILALASFRGPEADMVSAMLQNAFVAAGVADWLVAVVDADALFAPNDLGRPTLNIGMTTDNDIFSNFAASSEPNTILHAWRGHSLADSGSVATVQLLDARQACANVIDSMFPVAKSLCPDAMTRKLIYTSRWSVAAKIGRQAGLTMELVKLVKLVACLSSLGMENAPPLFGWAPEFKGRKPGIKKVAEVLNRALDEVAEAVRRGEGVKSLVEVLPKAVKGERPHYLLRCLKRESAGFRTALALAAFARCRFQGEEEELFKVLERFLGVTQTECHFDDFVGRDVAATLQGGALVERLAGVDAMWAGVVEAGWSRRMIKEVDVEKPHKQPFHQAPKSAAAGAEGQPFQGGCAFNVDLHDGVERLHEASPDAPKSSEVPPVPPPPPTKDYKADTGVFNRKNLVGQVKDMSGMVPQSGAEEFLGWFQRLPALRCVVISVLLAVAGRMAEEVGGFDVVGQPAFFGSVFWRLKEFLGRGGQAVQKKATRRDPQFGLSKSTRERRAAKPSLKAKEGGLVEQQHVLVLDGGETLGKVTWTWDATAEVSASERLTRIISDTCDGLDRKELLNGLGSFPAAIDHAQLARRLAQMAVVSLKGKGLVGLVAALAQLLGTSNTRAVRQLFGLEKAFNDQAKLERGDDAGDDAGEDDGDEDDDYLPDEVGDNEDADEEGLEDEGDSGLDKDVAAIKMETAKYDEACAMVKGILDKVNGILERLGRKPVVTLADFFELFSPANFKRAASDETALPFAALVVFVCLLRQLLPEKHWSWLPRVRRLWHWSFSNSWLSRMFESKERRERWQGWFGDVEPLWKNVLHLLPYVRRSAAGFIPQDAARVATVLASYGDFGINSVITDGCTVRVSGTKRWMDIRQSTTARYSALRLLKGMYEEKGLEWSPKALLLHKADPKADPKADSEAEVAPPDPERSRAEERPKLRKNSLLHGVLTAKQFCALFPDPAHVEQFIEIAKVSLDFGQRKPLAGVMSCGNVCTPIQVTANVMKQKHGKYSRREHKDNYMDKIKVQYNAAHPCAGATAADKLQAAKAAQDEYEGAARLSATPRTGATVPPLMHNVPLEHLVDARLRRELGDKKLRFGFEFGSELFLRTQEAAPAGWVQDVVCVVGGEATRGFSARGAEQVDTGPIYNVLRDHFLVILVPEYNSSQRCPKCFGQAEFVRAASYREKECKGCPCHNPRNHVSGDAGFAFRFDRDIGAAVNFLTILCFMMRHGGLRPAAFAPSNAKDIFYKNR